MDIRMLP